MTKHNREVREETDAVG